MVEDTANDIKGILKEEPLESQKPGLEFAQHKSSSICTHLQRTERIIMQFMTANRCHVGV